MQHPTMSILEAAEKTNLRGVPSAAKDCKAMIEVRFQTDGLPYGLSIDEASSLCVYTAETELYGELNRLLRSMQPALDPHL